MPKLTDAVLRMALADVRAWRRNGIEAPVSVNISAMDMMMPGFIDSIAGKLAEYRVPARHLTLEVTERVLVHDLPRARDIMVKLNKLGNPFGHRRFRHGMVVVADAAHTAGV